MKPGYHEIYSRYRDNITRGVLKPGDQVHLALKKRGVFLFDRETGERIR